MTLYECVADHINSNCGEIPHCPRTNGYELKILETICVSFGSIIYNKLSLDFNNNKILEVDCCVRILLSFMNRLDVSMKEKVENDNKRKIRMRINIL